MIRVNEKDFKDLTSKLFGRDINEDLTVYTRDSISSICVAFGNTSTNSYQIMREYLVELGIVKPIPMTSIMNNNIDTLGSLEIKDGEGIGIEFIPAIVKRNLVSKEVKIIDIDKSIKSYL